MSDTVKEETTRSAEDLKPIIQNIKDKLKNKSGLVEKIGRVDYLGFMLIAHNMDKNLNISNDCSKCGICKKVCPVNNIDMDADGKPFYLHHCEHCLSCLQHCPAKAINYKNLTQNRKRYTHPDISWKELADLYGNLQ
jgi:ferredoxin